MVTIFINNLWLDDNFYEVVSFIMGITGRYKGFKIKVFDKKVDDGYPPTGSVNGTDFDMVHSSDNTSDWVCASIVTHLLREQSNRGGGRVCHHRQEALMYKQSHNNNDIESMIFVLHIEGRIFCNCFWYFLFLHYLQFSQGAALGHLRTLRERESLWRRLGIMAGR